MDWIIIIQSSTIYLRASRAIFKDPHLDFGTTALVEGYLIPVDYF